jgi:hypothetical protein
VKGEDHVQIFVAIPMAETQTEKADSCPAQTRT